MHRFPTAVDLAYTCVTDQRITPTIISPIRATYGLPKGSDEFGWTEETSFVAFDERRKETRMLLTAVSTKLRLPTIFMKSAYTYRLQLAISPARGTHTHPQDMGVGYDDHSLYHWPTPRALATARHLISEGTSGSLDGEGDITADLALHIGDIAYGTGYGAKWDR